MKPETLLEFLAATKPEWAIPVDVLVTAQLIVLDGQPYPGHEAVAARCGLRDDKAVVRSLGRLRAASWVVKGPEGAYTVQASKLPRKESK